MCHIQHAQAKWKITTSKSKSLQCIELELILNDEQSQTASTRKGSWWWLTSIGYIWLPHMIMLSSSILQYLSHLQRRLVKVKRRAGAAQDVRVISIKSFSASLLLFLQLEIFILLNPLLVRKWNGLERKVWTPLAARSQGYSRAG